MMNPDALPRIVRVIFENRPDGGLRVYSDDVPGLILSGRNREAVLADVGPALMTIMDAMDGVDIAVNAIEP